MLFMEAVYRQSYTWCNRGGGGGKKKVVPSVTLAINGFPKLKFI